jgi:dolichol kinase
MELITDSSPIIRCFAAFRGYNLLTLLAAYIALRVVWRPPSQDQIKSEKELQNKINDLKRSYHTFDVESSGSNAASNGRGYRKVAQVEAKECLEGESQGDYSEPWTNTFDLVFVIIMLVFLVILCIWTTVLYPELWGNYKFWLGQLPKISVMMLVSYLGGLACRYFCEHDEKGYIITNKDSVFKVNYTRKLQHFAAYMVPLLIHTGATGVNGEISLAWGDFFTLLGFLILIKPIRERFEFVMLQFNALDRPEDRPNTLSWIVGGNILPGAVMIVFFRWLYSYTGQEEMAYIFVFITGIGDGLAEPVGIYMGKHKYWTASLFGDRKYQRSYEGSACVWISGVIFVSIMWYTFATPYQFWVAMIVIPPLMTYAEATSPHTLDTPFLMGLGGFALWFINHVSVYWH